MRRDAAEAACAFHPRRCSETFFKCKANTALSRLMNAYCQRQGVSLQAVRFLFDGSRVNSTQTPESLEMEDGDVIDVMVEQQGGGRR